MDRQLAITVKEGLPEAEHQQLFGWGEDLFGDAIYGYTWERKRWHVLVAVNGQLASHVGLIRRVVRADKEPILVGGIGGVITLPAHRGRGLAGLALREAAVFVREGLGAVLACSAMLTAKATW